MSSLFPALPVFLDLVGRSVVILSGDRTAAQLARDCLRAGAGVTVITARPGPEIEALSGVKIVRRAWRAADFRNAALVAAGCDERRMTRARVSAKSAKAIFMALDGGPGAEVTVGETAAVGPLTIGVAAAGLPTPLLEALHARLDDAVPVGLSGFMDAAAQCATLACGPGGREAWAAALAQAIAIARGKGAAPSDWTEWLERQLSSPQRGK